MDASVNSQVKMGNGALVQVKGKGTIVVQINVGTKYIQDVLLVPDLQKNLLSVGQLLVHGYVVNFEDNGYCIYDKKDNMHLVKKINMEKNRSFPIVLKYGGDIALKVNNLEESWLWHRRFGHLDFHGLKLLSQNNMVMGLPSCIEDKEGVCEGCALGKHH